MTEHRRRPPRQWALGLLVLIALVVLGVGIGSALSPPTHAKVSKADVSTTPPDPTPSHDLGVLPSPPSAPPTKTSPAPAPTRTHAAPHAATARPSATKTPSPVRRGPTPSTSATRPPAPPPSSSPSLTPSPVLSPTEQLRTLVNQRRTSTPGGGGDLARYPGMDAYAQGLADSGAPLATGPYVEAVSVKHAPTAATAARAMAPTSPLYTRVGIGFHADYWVLVFS